MDDTTELFKDIVKTCRYLADRLDAAFVRIEELESMLGMADIPRLRFAYAWRQIGQAIQTSVPLANGKRLIAGGANQSQTFNSAMSIMN